MQRINTPKERLDKAAQEINSHNGLRAERVQLNGDGWLEITGPTHDVAKHIAPLANENTLEVAVREHPPCENVRVRIARAGNPHAFRQ